MQSSQAALILLYLLCMSCYGWLRYSVLTGQSAIGLLGILLAFVVLSLIVFFFPNELGWFKIGRRFRGVVYWAVLLMLTHWGVYGYYLLDNSSEDVLVAEVYWDAGIELHLRADGTYKALEKNIISDALRYGRYRLDSNRLILDGKLHIGSTPLKDTLTYDALFLYFELETPRKKSTEGMMKITMNELEAFSAQPR